MSGAAPTGQSGAAPSGQVVVIGSANVDYHLRVDRSPAPGQTVLAEDFRKSPGGKGANQAVAAARLGGHVAFVAAVGDDDDGAMLLHALRSEGVQTAEVEVVANRATGLAVVAVDRSGENSILVVPGANFALTADRVRRVIRAAAPGTTLAMQAEIAPDVIAAALAAAEEEGLRVVLNLAPFIDLPPKALAVCDPLVLNESEASELTGQPVHSVHLAQRVAQDLLGRSRSVVITLGDQGAVWADAAGAGAIGAEPVAQVVDTTGAGDAFVGALAVHLANGGTLVDAVRLGVAAGSFAVTRSGAQSSYPSAADLAPAAGALQTS